MNNYSHDWLNIRFGAYHLRGFTDDAGPRISWERNHVHLGKPWYDIAVYSIFGWRP